MKTNSPLHGTLDSKIHTTTSSKSLTPAEQTSGCFIEKLELAAHYSSLAYVKSQLNPFTINSFQNSKTHQLYQDIHEKLLDAYDDLPSHASVGAILHIQPQHATIAFHGINFDSQNDHVTNFDSTLVPSKYAPGKYHRGFLNIATKITPNIIAILRQHLGILWYRYPLKISGHSMGGAVAQLFTQYLQHRYDQLDIETIVFGAPKTMCPTAAAAYNCKNNQRSFRVENPDDLAIYMPTRILGYATVDQSVQLPKLPKSYARNHEIEGYLENLENIKTTLNASGLTHISKEHVLFQKANQPATSYLWPFKSPTSSQQTPFEEFLGTIGHSISHGIQAIIRKLPF